MTDGAKLIETVNVPASAVGGQPFGGSEGRLTGRPSGPISLVDTSPSQAAGRVGQEAGGNGSETGENGAGGAAGPNEAQRRIADQAGEGAANPDKAREALEEIANHQLEEALLTLFTDFATPMVRGKVIEVFRALVKGKGEEERKALQEKFSSFLKEIGAQEGDNRFSKLITELKDSPDLASSALGYDLEIAMKSERVRQIDEYLRENPNASDRQQQEEERNRLASEIEALKKERNGQIEIPQNASEEERKKIEEQNKKGQERSQKFPQDQVEAQLRPLVGKIAEVAGLSEEQRKKLKDKDPLSAMTEIFGGVIDRCIEVGEKGISIQPKALTDFTQGLLNSGLINENGANEINDLATQLEKLDKEVTELLKGLMLKEGGKKGLAILLGILGVLAVLGYISAQKEMGGGGGRHMM
jgi:flagellar biosynthesis GTPase FlhF